MDKKTTYRIGLFCSAAEDISPAYFQAATALGTWMGQQGMTLVYGGADMGLMECTARAVKQNGGRVVGVVPTKLQERNHVSSLLDELISTRSLSDRKDLILQHSDVLVALPGGMGTLDEVFHVIGAATIGYHSKKVILYNVNHFWDPCLTMLREMQQQQFLRTPLEEVVLTAHSLEELQSFIQP